MFFNNGTDYEKERRDYIKRQSRVFEGGDFAVGLLVGAAAGVIMFLIAGFTPLLEKELVLNFLGAKLDLRVLFAMPYGALCAAAIGGLGMIWSYSRRKKKAEEEAAEEAARKTEERRRKSRLY